MSLDELIRRRLWDRVEDECRGRKKEEKVETMREEKVR